MRLGPMARSPWLFDPLVGIALGLLVLGVGSRIAMRVIAHATNVAPGFSLGGTMTVVFMGAVSGAAGGVIYALLVRFLPDRPLVRGALFAVILTLLTLRGASPSTPLTLSLFFPLTFLYGGLLDYIHRRHFGGSAAPLASRIT